MLEDIDRVPWGRLHHAGGSASDVPELLRSLAAGNAAARARAWSELWGNLWHQGTIWEATAHAVPFLLELAGEPSVPNRHFILAYLGDLATGSASRTEKGAAWMAGKWPEKDLAGLLARARSWERDTETAVAAGLPLYRALLADPQPLLRAGAARLLGICREDAAANFVLLCEHLDRGEADEVAAAALVYAIGLLAPTHAPARGRLQAVVDSDASAAGRVLAALALAGINPQAVSQPVRDLLVATVEDPEPAKAVIRRLPWDKGEIEEDCEMALAEIEAASADTP